MKRYAIREPRRIRWIVEEIDRGCNVEPAFRGYLLRTRVAATHGVGIIRELSLKNLATSQNLLRDRSTVPRAVRFPYRNADTIRPRTPNAPRRRRARRRHGIIAYANKRRLRNVLVAEGDSDVWRPSIPRRLGRSR